MEEEAENMDQIQQDAGNEVPVPDMNALNLNEDNDRKTNKDLPSKLCDPKQFPTWALRMRIHFEAPTRLSNFLNCQRVAIFRLLIY